MTYICLMDDCDSCHTAASELIGYCVKKKEEVCLMYMVYTYVCITVINNYAIATPDKLKTKQTIFRHMPTCLAVNPACLRFSFTAEQM